MRSPDVRGHDYMRGAAVGAEGDGGEREKQRGGVYKGSLSGWQQRKWVHKSRPWSTRERVNEDATRLRTKQ